MPDFQSVAAADCYENNRTAVAAACQGKAYQDFRELLARDDIDAVIIATPDHWHVPIGIMAARAGKHIYIEKPLGVTIEQDLATAESGRREGSHLPVRHAAAQHAALLGRL